MAGKWHIDINGNVAPCGAEKIERPRQRAGSPHFTSEEEGQIFIQGALEAQYGIITSLSKSIQAKSNAGELLTGYDEIYRKLIAIEKAVGIGGNKRGLDHAIAEAGGYTLGTIIDGDGDFEKLVQMEGDFYSIRGLSKSGSPDEYETMSVSALRKISKPVLKTQMMATETITDKEVLQSLNEYMGGDPEYIEFHPDWKWSQIESSGDWHRSDGTMLQVQRIEGIGNRSFLDTPGNVYESLDLNDNGLEGESRSMEAGWLFYDTRTNKGFAFTYYENGDGIPEPHSFELKNNILSSEGCQFYEVNGTGETIDVPYFVRADPAEYVS